MGVYALESNTRCSRYKYCELVNREYVDSKILNGNITKQLNRWRLLGKKIVFTNGCFDILHSGHLDYLIKASNIGDRLIVGLNTDASVKRLKGETRPINSERDRAFQLANLLCVDAVCLFDEDTPYELIKLIRPDVLVKGGDYDIYNMIGADIVRSYGGIVGVVPLLEGYSTTAIIKRINETNS